MQLNESIEVTKYSKQRGRRPSPLEEAKKVLFYILVQKLQNMAHITQEQRYIISVLKTEGFSQKTISERINKDKSVVSRELKRNRDLRNNEYKADLAQRKYEKRKAGIPKKIYFTTSIKELVKKYLLLCYSPEQIVGVCKLNKIPLVSVERIYPFIWADKKGGGTLHENLRNKGKKYRKRGSSKDKRGVIVGRVDIDQRPKIVEERKSFGDLEADTIVGKDHQGGLLTVNDRMTGLVKTRKLTTREAQEMEVKMVDAIQVWEPYTHTITSDNGKEFGNHKAISEALNIGFYFAKPHHPWERGSNENCNRLLRQFFSKGTDFSTVSEEDVQKAEDLINNRPRKRYGYLSPNQVFNNLNLTPKVAFVT